MKKQLYTALAGLALLAGGCAGRPAAPDVTETATADPVARQQVVSQVASAQETAEPDARNSASGEEELPPEMRELLESPAARALELQRQAREKMAEIRAEESEVDYIVNPETQEEWLPGSGQGILIPETVFIPTDEQKVEVEPVFDAVGEQAKDEYVKGALLNQTGYTTRAMQHFREAVAKDPDNLWLKNRAAQIALQQNDFPRAEAWATSVLDADPDNYQAMITLATLAYYRDKVEDARSWYQRILEVRPNHEAALENLARIAYYNDKDLEKTKEYARRIMDITSRNMNAVLWHAEASALTGEVRYAAELYEQLVGYRPSLIRHLEDMGRTLVREDRKEDALELYRRGVLMAPRATTVRLRWEQLVEELQGEDAVREAYGGLISESPLDLAIHELFADYLLRSNQIDALEQERLAMLEIDPRHIPSLLSLARINLNRGDTEKATEYFDEALAAGPEDASVWRDVALVYLEQGNTGRAEELLEEAMILDPEDSATLVALASLAEESGDDKRAEEMMKRAIDASPGNATMLRVLGEFYRQRDRLDEASQIFEQIIAAEPADTGAHLQLADLYFQLEDEDALDTLERMAPGKVSDTLGFYVDYGIAAMRNAHWDRARRALQRAVDIMPSNIGYRGMLARAYLHLDEAELAEQVFENASEHMEDDEEKLEELKLTRAGFYTLARQYDEALELMRELAEANPDDLAIRSALIQAMLDADVPQEEIIDELNQAVAQFMVEQPDEVKMLRATVYREQGDTDRALSILEPMLRDAEDNLSTRFEIALTHGMADDIRNADRYYSDLIEELEGTGNRPGILINSYNNLAYLFAVEGVELERANELAKKALEMNPTADYILDTVGWVKFRRKEYQEAEKYLKRADKLSLGDPEILRNLGDFYRETGQPLLALEYYERGMRIDPDYEGLRERVDALRQVTSAGNESPTEPEL